MYACTSESGADFSRGCTVQRIGQSFLATHPRHPEILEWHYGNTPSLRILAIANLHSLLRQVVGACAGAVGFPTGGGWVGTGPPVSEIVGPYGSGCSVHPLAGSIHRD
jgi:hypothetical protein